ncbi:MAG: choice-of-anchor B family protein [Candidatus Zixiibacteriota bacterium]
MTARNGWFGALHICLFAFLVSTPALGVDCNLQPPRPPVTLDSIATFTFNTFGGTDCWGWTGPDGTEYAIMGTAPGISFVNVTTLQEVGTVTGPISGCGSVRWRDIKTYRNYCYAVSECTGTNQGIMIIDMQWLPDSVHYVGSFIFNNENRSHNLSIDTAAGFLYAIKQNYSGFRVISLANPVAPVELPYVNTVDLHDVFARNDTVWAAEATRGTWSAWDMSNKNSPQLIARVSVPNPGYVHNIWPTVDGRYAVTTEETANKTIKVWDTQDWQNVALVAEYIAPSNLAHNVHVFGNYVVTSHYESGLHIADVSIPECPETVASFDTWPTDNSNYNGCWGAYPFTANGMMYASNLNGKLFILQSSISPVDFDGAPVIGEAPLSVDFTDLSIGGPSAWDWDFGDGDGSASQNPTHEYTQGGIYDVTLGVTTPGGTKSRTKQQFVTVLAETLTVADREDLPNTAGYFEIDAQNTVPLTEFVLAVNLTNVPNVIHFDSIGIEGTRASHFELSEIVFDNRFNGQLAMRFRADDGGGAPPVPPGDGPIARVHYRTRIFADPGDTSHLSMTTLGSYSLNATTWTTSFVPAFPAGATLHVVAPPCDCSGHGDVVDNGLLDAVDLAFFIDFIFYAGAQPPTDAACPHIDRGDFDCDGIDTPVDLAELIDAVFFGGAPPCDPCACSSYPSSCP